MNFTSRLFTTFVLLLLGSLLAAHPQDPESSFVEDAVEFEGLYDYHDGGTLFMVADGDHLVAVINEAKYVLRQAGADAFTNPGGDLIPFVRSATGDVIAFREGSETFRKRSPAVPIEVRRLLRPRPLVDGRMNTDDAYTRPPELGDGIPTASAGAGTIPVEVASRLVAGVIDGTYPDVRSILVFHDGALRVEEYFYGFDRERPHQMRSLTKSVVSLVAGAAIDRGLLQPDEPALHHLGYTDYANPDPRKAQITLLDLLSHQSGLACNDRDENSPGAETTVYETDDWMRTFVDLPMVAPPGTVAHYCSAGILAAGRIVERAARMPLGDFAATVLLDPLGIDRGDWTWTFELERSQRDDYGQIHLRPRDMLKLGMLLEQRGSWNGQTVVSEAWVNMATSRRSQVDDSDYGLGIWHRWYNVSTVNGGARRIDTIMLSGNGGQKVYLVPSLGLIAVFTGGSFNAETPTNEMMADVLLPALLEEAQTEED